MKWVSAKEDPTQIKVAAQLPSRFIPPADQAGLPKPEILERLALYPYPLDHELFVAYEGEEPIASFLLQLAPEKGVGYVGLVALHPDARHEPSQREAWLRAEEWFRARGVRQVQGPLTYSTWFPYRFRKDDHPLKLAWEPAAPPADRERFLALGFTDYKHYTSTCIQGIENHYQRTLKDFEKSQAAGYVYRALSQETLESDIVIMHQLVMDTFVDNYLFTPLSLEAFKQIYVPNMKHVDLEMSCLVYDPAGKPVSFHFMFQDDRRLVFKTACVLEECRGQGLTNGTVHFGVRAAKRRGGIDQLVIALIFQGNKSGHWASYGEAAWVHEYVLMAKELV